MTNDFQSKSDAENKNVPRYNLLCPPWAAVELKMFKEENVTTRNT